MNKGEQASSCSCFIASHTSHDYKHHFPWGLSLPLRPWFHRCTDTSGYKPRRSTSCVFVFRRSEAARSPPRSPCSPSRQADHRPRNWTQTCRQRITTFLYDFVNFTFTLRLRCGGVEVGPVHPAPVSLVFSLYQSDPVVIVDFNDSWEVVLEVQWNTNV